MSKDAYDDLVRAVDQMKRHNALSLVTVVVPGAAAVRDAMKHLASSGGLANTRVCTLSQAVAYLAAAVLAPRVPLDYPLLEASTQKVLSENPGVFTNVADQSITAQAIGVAYMALAGHPNPTTANSTRFVGDMLRVHRLATGVHDSTYYLLYEAYAAAIDRLAELGRIIVFQPCETDPASLRVLQAMQERGETVVVDSDITGTMVVHTSDADDEVRAVARIVRRHLTEGTPGHRIGVFYGADDPYLHLIHEHFTNGAISFSGPDCTSLADRPMARTLLGLLQLDLDLMPRRELLGIFTERSLKRPQISGEPISLRKLELLTRRYVPIVGGADWGRLAQLERGDKRYEQAQSFHAFIEDLRTELRLITTATTWAAASELLLNLIDERFNTGSRSDEDATAADAETLRQICHDLRAMDGVAPALTDAGLVDALTVRIASVKRTVGRAGTGVSIGPISAGVGRDLDVCVVMGVAEGIVPARRREDPLLPPELTGRTLADELKGQHRQLLLTLGSGRNHRIMTFPRGSLRGGAQKVPSRWLIPTLEHLAGKKINVVDWQKQTQGIDTIVTVESFDVATQRFDPRIGVGAASPTEWRLRALAGVPARERRNVLDDDVVLRGMEMRSDRLNGRFTRYNGNVSAASDLVRFFDMPVSPSRLEDWVASPYRFFVRTLLGVDALHDPDDEAQLDPLTRGNLIHATLEQYIQSVMDGKDATLDRLLGIADDVLHNARIDSPGWLPQLWAKDSGIIRRDLVDWHDHDTRDRDSGWTPLGVERKFGDHPDLVQIEVAGGAIGFTGSIDRIDAHQDGRIRVTDYKTGKIDDYKKLSQSEPTDGGTKFQLPVYGLFAATLGQQVSARYWFASSRGNFDSVDYDVTDAVIDILRTDLELVHRAVAAGYFPPRPPQTFWADPLVDLIGKAGLERAWVNLDDVPEIADYLAKHGG
ncbi:MAG: PD-(D/E)XK nuclease family protein [Gordonia sp.]|nr:PD-(D/E)XK nuclease family protein [Gordonia sp. (in: high G+C Gram-positive bacteria)]